MTTTESLDEHFIVDEIDHASDLKLLGRMMRRQLGRYKLLLVGVVILQAIQTVATLYLPTINANIVDNGIIPGDTGYIWQMGAIMLAITVAQIAFAAGAVYFAARAAMGFGRDVRRVLFHHVANLSTREVGRFGSSSLITRITNDVQQIQMLVLMTCTVLVAAPITMVGGVLLALQQDVQLTGLLLVGIPLLLGVVGFLIVKLVPEFQRMQGWIDRVNLVLREQLLGIRVVRAFTREPEEVERFAGANGDLTATSLRVGRLMAYMLPAIMLILNGSSVAALWIGGDRIGDGDLQVGQLIAFLSYLVQILAAVMTATFMAILVPRAAVSAQRIEEVLATKSSIVDAAQPNTNLPDRVCTLEFSDVGFQYPGAEGPVLSGITFTARRGETIAIVGGTGSGKTTLVNLIPRLFDATHGSVSVDGVEVRDVGLAALRDRIGLVPQKPFLFSGSIASNLRLADRHATDEQLWAAIGVAEAQSFVDDSPSGLDAPIAQGGTNVSGGQRQRLAIARALVHRPSIYVFDDSFSSLDLATDARVRAGLAGYTDDAIVVIVGQRISSIRDADQILVLDSGRQVGLGTHDRLLVDCPTYVEIVDSQLKEEAA